MVTSRAVFLALRAAVGWYADVWNSQALEVFGYEMELLPDGASVDPALSSVFIRIASYELPDISRGFEVASEFVRAEIIELRKIESAVQLEADLLSAKEQNQTTLELEPMVLFKYVVDSSEDEADAERHARYWHLKESR